MPATKKFVLFPGTTGSVLVFLQDGESPATPNWTNTEPARIAVARLVTYVEYDYYLAGGTR